MNIITAKEMKQFRICSNSFITKLWINQTNSISSELGLLNPKYGSMTINLAIEKQAFQRIETNQRAVI